MNPFDSWALARLLTGADINGEAESVSAECRPLVDFLGRVSVPDGLEGPDRREALASVRSSFWDAMKAANPKLTGMEPEIDATDPERPPPEVEDAPPERPATLADVRRVLRETKWPWPGWLVSGALNVSAADPGTGKTVLAAELARRLWFAEPWPDGQANPFPVGTTTLWIAGDRHFVQLMGLAESYGLPDGAVLFNAPANDPTGGLDLDDPAELAALRSRILVSRPGMVIVDTVGMTTDRNLCRPEDARSYFGPLMDLAGETGIPFLLLTHLSKDSQALGRRIVGAARVVWKLTTPDPDGQPNRRRLWVDKSYLEKPPPLGMTIGDAGCVFDFNPPVAPEPDKGGRPPDKLNKCMQFIAERLADKDRPWKDLIAEWEGMGEAKGTIFNACEAMKAKGTLIIDGSIKPKVCRLVNNPQTVKFPVSDPF